MTPTAKETRNLARLILSGGENAEVAKTIIEGNPDLLPDLAAEFEYNGFGAALNPDRFDVRKPETWKRLDCFWCGFRTIEFNTDEYDEPIINQICTQKSRTFQKPCTKFKDQGLTL